MYKRQLRAQWAQGWLYYSSFPNDIGSFFVFCLLYTSEVLENDTKEKVALTEEQEQALLSFIKTDNVYHKYYDDVPVSYTHLVQYTKTYTT